MIRKTILLALAFLVGHNIYADKTKIACVGNSITFGAGIEQREQNSYPAQLQKYLGEDFEVRNFGVSGTTLLHNGDHPYIQTRQYEESLAFNPDIVFIKLGTNDSKPQNRIHLDAFKQDYIELVKKYRSLPSSPRIVLLTPVRCFIPGSQSICDSVIQRCIAPVVREIAFEQDVELINLYNLYGETWDKALMPDKLHPSAKGAEKIAFKLFQYISVKESNGEDIVTKFPLTAKEEFNFYGYKGYKYDNNGVTYHIVRPHRIAEGNPWIWRARFWGHEPQTDIAMLENGFYLTYCEVGDLFGSSRALKRWDTFYKLATKAGLHKKAVLEGMSRGGLIVYNWTAKNTSKVACIYGDAPVMDLKSWPMGLPGDPNTPKMLAAYGFANESEAAAWKKNPVDHAKKIAKARIPLLHVVGDADTGVPVANNTAVFEKRMEQYGHKLNVIHKPGVGHHPHSLFNPEPIVSFMLKATGRWTAP